MTQQGATGPSKAPWLVAAVSVLVLAATVVFAVVMLSGGSDDKSPAGASGTTTYQPGDQSIDKVGKYKPGKVENACAALDLAAIERLGYPAEGKPIHEETNTGTGGSLECSAGFQNASLAGQANFDWHSADELFEQSKASAIAAPPAGTTAAALSNLGASAYYTLEDSSVASRTDIEVKVEAKDENLFVRITFRVSGFDIQADREAVRQAAEFQARTMMDRLR
ncbi:hypothetical protein [Nocardia sp. XZ_19_385]|uniref:hypothetical protein n=1 Tax=Nocardia sp. XZ_19_385 TaxID=2769488 RepID=UPI00188FAB0A|nr:hypothetical protein [Nocardia sp. XZ_19_385]